MRILKPPAVYINETVLKNHQAKECLDRVMSRIETPTTEVVSDEKMDELIKQKQWKSSRRRTGNQRQGDPAVVFDTYRWPPDNWIDGEPLPRKFRNVMLGPWNHAERIP